jgi:uncharacterized protein YjiS (DUF1127 family)
LNRVNTATTNGQMEVSMLEDVKFELSTLDFRALTPEQWSRLKDRLIEQARERRNAELRVAIGKVLAGPERLLRMAVRAFLVARRRKAAVSALSALDDRSLRDIGLRRGEIVSAVYRTGEARRA